MYKSDKPQKMLKTSLTLSLGALTMLTAPMHAIRADDTPPPPNPNSEVTGAVDVAKGVVNELEDELAKHMNQTSFDAEDYKAWNKEFRAKLDAETALFAETLEAQVAAPLKPLTDQYQEILQDTSLRPDQAAALKQVELTKINQLAATLAPAYQNAYSNLIKGVMGFLPVASFQLNGDHVNDHTMKNFGTIMFDIITLGIGIDFKHEIPAIREADFAYTVNSMDGTAQPMTGELRVAAMNVDVANGIMNVSSIDGDSSSFQNYSSNVLSSCLSQLGNNGYGESGTGHNFDDPKAYEKAIAGDIQGNACTELSAIDAEGSQSSPSHSIVFDNFIAKPIKDGCQSQVCLTLKESDLSLTLNTLVQKLAQPFQVTFSDGNSIQVGAPSADVAAYQAYLSIPVVDASLPFDTTK